jgi:cytochrome oxidase Cu insertion factor (SCO1/SenC/PrrC family)
MRHRFSLLALLVALVLAAAGCGGDPPPDPPAAAPSTTTHAGPDPATRPPTSETARPAPKGVIPAGERQPAPDIQVTDFDGRTITLGGFRGQPVVVNFFESW